MRILSRLPDRRGTAPLQPASPVRKRFEPTRSGAPVREQPEDGLAPARGIAIALGIGALAWIALLLVISL